ncbi:MAG TPA: RNA-binding S4 domain-containing protein [Aquabacterium sp.]|uniref:RNA-binding S4 domain-containing protein n=1 Tax=Aquabacterium sp. TaxID=1872578 RepID=UPI002E342434|nr:RNA-binding S4 domain-containing protein [Aquabacterium sp.]HEX5371755.1 RNA-binding S4 domain-containing protein [Aquabacterium sp.]
MSPNTPHHNTTETGSVRTLPGQVERLRLDKWLWVARFFKTRALAADEIDKGRIQVNDQVAKASRELRAGDRVDIRQAGGPSKTVIVRALSTIRGPAPQAQQLFEETPESIERRQQQAERRRLGVVEPAESIVQGRPTKRDRRQLADWDRWSASANDIDD